MLSWSLLEAMSCGCPVVGSATPPVQEVIRDRENGRLVSFFDHGALAATVADLLGDPHQAGALGERARQTIQHRYALDDCVPQHLALMELVARGALGAGAMGQ